MKYVATMLSAALVLGLAGIATEASAGGEGYGPRHGNRDCYKCPPPRNYDSTEVLKTTKDVDHSRTIETQSVVPSKRLIETNHLIIRENETRNVGVVQHNHTIIKKELVLTKRNLTPRPSTTSSIWSSTSTIRSASASSRSVKSPARTATLRARAIVLATSLARESLPTVRPSRYAKAPKYVNSRY